MAEKNRKIEGMPLIKRLGVSYSALKELKKSGRSGAEWLARLDELRKQPGQPEPEPLDPSKYENGIELWLKNEDNYSRIMHLITLTTPILVRAKSTAYGLGDCVRPTSSSDPKIWYECTSPGVSQGDQGEPIDWATKPGQSRTALFWTGLLVRRAYGGAPE